MNPYWQQEDKPGFIEYSLSVDGKGIAKISQHSSFPKNEYELEIYITTPITRRAILADSMELAKKMALIILEDIVNKNHTDIHKILHAIRGFQ